MRGLRRLAGWRKSLPGLIKPLSYGFAAMVLVGEAGLASARQIRLQDVINTSLSDNPSLYIQQEQMRLSEGNWQATLGRYDPQLLFSLAGSRDHTPLETPDALVSVSTDVSAYSVRVQKQFRSGLTLTPEVQMIRRDNLASGGVSNNASVGLSLQMPLLRDRGVRVNAAGERAARHDYEASVLSLQQTRADVVLRSTLAYWSYLASWKTLEAYRESEARARTLMDETKVLIEAEERPAADLKQLEANLAAKTAQRIATEQRLFEAEQQLGLAMGLPFEQMRALGTPLDVFPQADETLLAQVARNEPYIALPRARRADLKAAQTRERAAQVLLYGARNDLKPRMDLTVELGYAGLETGTALEQYFTPFGQHVGGLNVGVTLSYAIPFRNRTAEGIAAQRASAYQQRVITARDLDRVIRSSVLVALKALERSVYELKSSEAAIELYRTAIANEKKNS